MISPIDTPFSLGYRPEPSFKPSNYLHISPPVFSIADCLISVVGVGAIGDNRDDRF
jgi:hypothetical protein